MLEICVFVVHIWWASLLLVVGMSPLDSSDNDNVPTHLIDEIVMDTISVDYTYFL